jgi:LysM domain.
MQRNTETVASSRKNVTQGSNYKVQSGDTLFGIAQRSNISLQTLCKAIIVNGKNQLKGWPKTFYSGQQQTFSPCSGSIKQKQKTKQTTNQAKQQIPASCPKQR